jgi:hypothetical protein
MYRMVRGGEGGIRTPVTLSGQTVFKTVGFNHSPTSPLLSLPVKRPRFKALRGMHVRHINKVSSEARLTVEEPHPSS